MLTVHGGEVQVQALDSCFGYKHAPLDLLWDKFKPSKFSIDLLISEDD